MKSWVVRVEAGSDSEVIEATDVMRVLECLGDFLATGLHVPDRYVVQMVVGAENPVEALHAGVAHWNLALELTGLPQWPILRAEVETPEELQASFAAVERGDDLSEPWDELGEGPWPTAG
jgi:hypothetical protein